MRRTPKRKKSLKIITPTTKRGRKKKKDGRTSSLNVRQQKREKPVCEAERGVGKRRTEERGGAKKSNYQ